LNDSLYFRYLCIALLTDFFLFIMGFKQYIVSAHWGLFLKSFFRQDTLKEDVGEVLLVMEFLVLFRLYISIPDRIL